MRMILGYIFLFLCCLIKEEDAFVNFVPNSSKKVKLCFNNNALERDQCKGINKVITHTILASTVSSSPQIKTEENEVKVRGTSSIKIKDDIGLISSEVSSNTKKSYLDDGFVFGLDGSGLERTKGKVATVVVDGDTTETKPYQIFIVLSTFLFHSSLLLLNTSDLIVRNGNNMSLSAIQWLMIVTSSWILADFGSGVLHFSVDNYGNGRTPIFGNLIAAFQGHHSAPWTITERGFFNNIYKLCIPFGIPTMMLINWISGPSATIFFSIFCMIEILSQEFHKWSHMTKSEAGDWINFLQEKGIVIGRVRHAKHHIAPYDGNYCIVSGFCNNFLDSSGFFRKLEHIIYKINGVESNAWKIDMKLKQRTLQGNYKLKRHIQNKWCRK